MNTDELRRMVLRRLALMLPEQRISIDSMFLVSAAELSRLLAPERKP